MPGVLRVALLVLATAVAPADHGAADPPPSPAPDLSAAHHAFYSAHYETAATLALESREAYPDALVAFEVRTAALLFDLKRRLGDDRVRRVPLDQCGECAGLLDAFHVELTEGQRIAREFITADPGDASAHFFLAKLDLNYLWLQNGPLRRRTGWKEYREARRSLEQTLASHPDHLRARVALAWVDYVVDTRMPWGTKWLFGGGDRDGALASMRAAASAPDGHFYDLVEARFGLWEMLQRENELEEAVLVAHALARDFPDNGALAEFVDTHGMAAARVH